MVHIMKRGLCLYKHSLELMFIARHTFLFKSQQKYFRLIS